MSSNYNPIPAHELRARYWFLSHIMDVRNVGNIIFIAFDSILVCIVCVYLVNLYGIQLLSYPRALRSMAQPLTRISADSSIVNPINISETGSVGAGEGHTDLYALIQNPNANFMARFTYSFFDDETHRSFQGFIYPGQQKYLLDIGAPSVTTTSNQFHISDLHWTRISSTGLADINARTKLTVKDFQYIPNSDTIPFSRLMFTISNPTGYNFAHIALPVVLRYGGSVVALHYTIIDRLMSAQSYNRDVRWFNPVGPVDGYSVNPDIDIFNPETFLSSEGEPIPPAHNE